MFLFFAFLSLGMCGSPNQDNNCVKTLIGTIAFIRPSKISNQGKHQRTLGQISNSFSDNHNHILCIILYNFTRDYTRLKPESQLYLVFSVTKINGGVSDLRILKLYSSHKLKHMGVF